MDSLPVRALECFLLLRGRMSAIHGLCGGGGREENFLIITSRQIDKRMPPNAARFKTPMEYWRGGSVPIVELKVKLWGSHGWLEL